MSDELYMYFDWAKSVERLYGDAIDEVFPYQAWMSKQAPCDEDGNKRNTRCQYCNQLSPDDMRGGCLACGGPR